MPKTTKIAKTAPESLKILWEEGYFRSWRKQVAIVGHLAKRGNNFSAPELGHGAETDETSDPQREARQLRIHPEASVFSRKETVR